jgi:site-specific DNA recombinase
VTPRPRGGPAAPPETRPGPVRVAIYLRRSTDEAHQPFSLDAQETKLRAYIASQDNWELAIIYSDDASGATLDRKDLKRALAAARASRYDLLLVYRVDRLSRSIRGLSAVLDELDTAGVLFRSATEPFDTATPAGRMMVQMLAVFAEFERATIIDRVINGMERKAARGQWCGGYRPHGYELDKATGYLTPVEAEAPIVKRIFRDYAHDRIGAKSIALALTADGHRTKAGKPWKADSVLTVLRNRAYLGEVWFRGTWYAAETHHPPLIDLDLFAAANAVLVERGENYSHRAANASVYTLAGHLICDQCGKRYQGNSARGRHNVTYRYYTCYTRLRHGPDHCPSERIPADTLENAIMDSLLDTLSRTDLIDQAITAHTAHRDQHRAAYTAERDAIDTQLDKINTAIDRYLTAFENGTLNEQTVSARLEAHADKARQLRQRWAELTAQLADLPSAPTLADLGELRDRLNHLIRHGNPAQVKAVLRGLIHEIRITDTMHAVPYFYVPAQAGPAGPTTHGGDTAPAPAQPIIEAPPRELHRPALTRTG